MPEDPASLELWGGVECTTNRVGEHYFDQLNASGHAERHGDLDAFHALGLRTLRYPVLWERTCQNGEPSFEWADRRLTRFRDLSMNPVVGLLHHGSGPRHTSLLDPEFPEQFAAYAALVAERYPWVEAYTPINEPLTTARFSCLYGHWYPHRRTDADFVRALLHQCRGTVLAMREIRKVNPRALLVQTEDMGHTQATAGLEYQAEFENERRFLSYDLLTGAVDSHHPMREYLLESGATEAELEWFSEWRIRPDVIGLNYYVTSERFLDGRVHLHPTHVVGGNGHHRYADVETVRVSESGLVGPGELLLTASRRYGRPVALTEAHLGCTPNERIRWLSYMVRGAREARRRGADVRAVCLWALLGSHGWNRLLTQGLGAYEAGVFSVEHGELRETDVTAFVKALVRSLSPDHPALCTPGWWQRDDRFTCTPYSVKSRAA